MEQSSIEGYKDHIDLTMKGFVAEVQINNAPGNRITWHMIRRLTEIAEYLEGHGRVRVVLISHAGQDFSHGVDLRDQELVQLVTEGEAGRIKLAKNGQKMIQVWSNLKVPAIAAGRGLILGGGACLFMSCPFRLAGTTARISFPEVDRGMHLSWGILPVLQREIGISTTRKLALLGEIVPVSEIPGAVYQQVSESSLEAQARTLAKQLVAKPPLAVQAILETLRSGDCSKDPQRFAATVGSEDFAEGLNAWMTRREPVFKGR